MSLRCFQKKWMELRESIKRKQHINHRELKDSSQTKIGWDQRESQLIVKTLYHQVVILFTEGNKFTAKTKHRGERSKEKSELLIHPKHSFHPFLVDEQPDPLDNMAVKRLNRSGLEELEDADDEEDCEEEVN